MFLTGDWFSKAKDEAYFISSLFDIARAVEESAVINAAELVGLHNRTVRVPTLSLGHLSSAILQEITTDEVLIPL